MSDFWNLKLNPEKVEALVKGKVVCCYNNVEHYEQLKKLLRFAFPIDINDIPNFETTRYITNYGDDNWIDYPQQPMHNVKELTWFFNNEA